MSCDGGVGARDLLDSWGTKKVHHYTSVSLERQSGGVRDAKGVASLVDEWDLFINEMNKFVQDYDAIICPVSTQTAMRHGDSYTGQEYPGFAEMFSYMMTFNLLGWPCGTVRAGTSNDGMPIGVQVAAGPWQEKYAISILRKLEDVGGWTKPGL